MSWNLQWIWRFAVGTAWPRPPRGLLFRDQHEANVLNRGCQFRTRNGATRSAISCVRGSRGLSTPSMNEASLAAASTSQRHTTTSHPRHASHLNVATILQKPPPRKDLGQLFHTSKGVFTKILAGIRLGGVLGVSSAGRSCFLLLQPRLSVVGPSGSFRK